MADPFRMAGSERSIRLRSWRLHDGILGEPFNRRADVPR